MCTFWHTLNIVFKGWLIKIYNWGTIERISTKTHKKAYAMTYTGKKPADMEVVLGVMGESAGISVSIK